MFLLDTCVVSEGPKPTADKHVARWLHAQEGGDLFISAVTAGELRFGVERRSAGAKADRLRAWLEEALRRGFPGRIVPFDAKVADLWGYLRAAHPGAEVADSQIAATALVHGMTLVTRNVKDFAFQGLSVFNPWRS